MALNSFLTYVRTKSCRLISMLTLTAIYFLVEIVVGYVTNSLALVADSFHMLSDVIALFVGFSSVRVSKWSSSKNTFGWARAEVMGALVNAVFLVALCFSILVEALERFIEVGAGEGRLERPKLMVFVGIGGLLINLVGLLLFKDHAHSHGGGHGHSHGRSHGTVDDETEPEINSNSVDLAASPQLEEVADAEVDTTTLERSPLRKGERGTRPSSQMNMKAVFLHVLGDALGSVVVVISGLLVWLLPESHLWKYYVDPSMSVILVAIILATTIPLLRESGSILMQTVPQHISVNNLQEKLLRNIDGILALHEFHIWRLTGDQIIATAHVGLCCHNLNDYMRIANNIKEFFHNEGIHSTTIQPEFIHEDDMFQRERQGKICALDCGPDLDCFRQTCCGQQRIRKSYSEFALRRRGDGGVGGGGGGSGGGSGGGGLEVEGVSVGLDGGVGQTRAS